MGRGVVTLRTAVAEGFRAPDFKELYLDFVNAAAGYAVKGNPDLKPEHSVNVTVGAEWRSTSSTLKVGAYQNRFRDFIETTGPDGSGVYTYSNVTKGTTAGVDVDASRQAGALDLSAGYRFLHTHNDADGGPLLGRAAHSARATISHAEPRFRTSIALSGIYTGSAPASRDANGAIAKERDALTQLNLRVGRSLGPVSSAGEVFAAVDNLFDATAGADWPGFTGRRLSAGLSWTFR
jgi:outer membrane receptor for ferrienterochelin and colicins